MTIHPPLPRGRIPWARIAGNPPHPHAPNPPSVSRAARLAVAICISCAAGGGSAAAAADDPPATVAPVRLADNDMTPVDMVLTTPVAAGAELLLRSNEPLRPVWLGIYQITRVTAPATAESIPLRPDPTARSVILKPSSALASGAKLTLHGRKLDSVDPARQRYTGRECRAWLEFLEPAKGAHPNQPVAAVSAPLVVRTVAGPVHSLQAYRKPDGRLLIQAFDKQDNPADDAGATYTITGDHGKTQVVQATAGPDITEVPLATAIQSSGLITVNDNANHHCRGTPMPRALDGTAIFFGDIHCHTSFSDGDYPTNDAIAWARHRIGLDFVGPGDHISQQGDFAGLTAVDYSRFGRRFEQPGRFCRIPALEISCAGGHQLLCARDFDTFVNIMAAYVKHPGPTADTMDSAAFYQALAGILHADTAMVITTHPIGHANRWPAATDHSRVRAAEIFHGGASHETHQVDPDWLAAGGRRESSIRHALDAGYQLGFLGQSDNHRCLPGQPMVGYHGMTAVMANQLDTRSVFDAIRHRRCYATSGARIVADATLNQAPVGSQVSLSPTQPRTFKIIIHGTAPIIETQIIHCGKVLKSFPTPDATQPDVALEWTDSPPANREIPTHEYYYIRARQSDGQCVWLSPIWIKPKS